MIARRRFTPAELWYLAAAPAAWFAHFLVLDGAAAVVCARPRLGPPHLLWPGALATVLAGVLVALVAVRGYRACRHRAAGEDAGSLAFLGELLLGIAVVSAVGILVTASVPLVIGVCW
jgi:hypothetical protein